MRASRAAEIEAARKLAPDVVDTLKSVGIFRMFVPQSHGGFELEFPKGLEIISALSRIDGSIGWSAAIGSTSATFIPLLQRETYERIYRDGPDVT